MAHERSFSRRTRKAISHTFSHFVKKAGNHGSSLVSVIIPVYNGERFLAETLESARKQTYQPLELLVIDDGSTDNSPQIIKGFSGAKFFSQPHLGVSTARNTGIAKARGEFLEFLDADDLWVPEKTHLQVDFLLEHPNLDGILSRFQNFFEPRVKIPDWVDPKNFLAEKAGRMPQPSTLLIRKSAFDRVGLFNPGYETGEDIDWFTRAKEAGLTFAMLPQVLALRRLHDANLSYRSRRDASTLLRIAEASVNRKKGGLE